MKRLDKLGLNADLLKDREMKCIVGGSSDISREIPDPTSWEPEDFICEYGGTKIYVSSCTLCPGHDRGYAKCYPSKH